MSILIGPTTPLGEVIEYRAAPSSYHDYVRRNLPSDVSNREFCKTFKKDLTIEFAVEKLNNADIYFIEFNPGRDDELYYFRCGDKLFHGEKVWSDYHEFLWSFQHIAPSCWIEQPCWFAGTRNNYTHQLLDFLPNLLLREELNSSSDIMNRTNVFGKTNSIIESLKESPLVKNAYSQKKLFLEDLGATQTVGKFNIRCVRFRDLMIPKNISIFKAYALLSDAFQFTKNFGGRAQIPTTNSIGFLSRDDGRIGNLAELEEHLKTSHGAQIINQLERRSYVEKALLLSSFETLVLPPGSDNINAFCFSDNATKLIQLSPIPFQKTLSSPFYSYAGIRIALPFLDRITIVPRIENESQELLKGNWCTREIDQAISRANVTQNSCNI